MKLKCPKNCGGKKFRQVQYYLESMIACLDEDGERVSVYNTCVEDHKQPEEPIFCAGCGALVRPGAQNPTELYQTVELLADAYGGAWGEAPYCPVEDWRQEVANNDTRLGYWEWAWNRLANDWEELRAEDQEG